MPRDAATRRLEVEAAWEAERVQGLREDGSARRFEVEAALAVERAQGLREDGSARRLEVEAALAVERAWGLREDVAARRIEVEAGLAAERARGLQQAAASFVGVFDMEVDSPRIHAPELDEEGCAPDSPSLNRLQGKRLIVDLSIDQDTLFFGNLCKEWTPEEFEELIHKAEPSIALFFYLCTS
ncbi:unnamed protein product [Urochloa humidicola]